MKSSQFAFIKIFIVFLIFSSACNRSSKQKENSTENKAIISTGESDDNTFSTVANSVFEIQTFDDSRLLETGHCFLIAESILVAPFSLFNGATRAEIAPINGGEKVTVKSFYAYDRINNLILLKVDSLKTLPLKFYSSNQSDGLKTFVLGKKMNNTQPVYSASSQKIKIIEGRKLLGIANQIGSKSQGTPIFVSNGEVIGIGISMQILGEKENFAIPATEINKLLSSSLKPKDIGSIGKQNVKKNQSIKHIVLETTFGNITIKLSNETPAYRDNFVQLAEEGFYDSLLIHRVIRDFGIQTGAADTRHALDDDIVGWKGPGYTIPAHLVKGLYHKRGAIGSPRKPDTKNKEKRSDGSQFYIVTGRKYIDEELDELEKENGIKYSSEQREVYKTIGGAPHLDGAYTVFGEVVSGIEVADKLTLMPVKDDFRPVNNVRLNTVKIYY